MVPPCPLTAVHHHSLPQLDIAPTQSPILPRHPSVAPNRSKSIENLLGIILVLDTQQAIIIDTKECFLEVRFEWIPFVHVCTRIWCQLP